MFCFISTDIGAHKPRLLAPFVMNLETDFVFFVSYIDRREKKCTNYTRLEMYVYEY